MRRNPLSWLARSAVARPWTSLLLSLALCGVSALGALRVQLETNVAALLPSGTDVLERFETVEEVFGSSDLLVFAVEQDSDPAVRARHAAAFDRARSWAEPIFGPLDIAIPERARQLHALTVARHIQDWTWQPPDGDEPEAMINNVIGVPDRAVDRAFREQVVANTWLLLDPGTTDDPGELEQVTRRLDPRVVAKALDHPLGNIPPAWQDRDRLGLWTKVYQRWWDRHLDAGLQLDNRGGYLSSHDDRFHVLIASATRQSQDSDFCGNLVERTQAMQADFADQAIWEGFQFQAIGGYFIAHRDYVEATNSAWVTMVTSLLGVLLLFALVYRSLVIAALITICLVPAVGAALGLAVVLLGGEVSMIVTAFAAILIGLGVDYFIHVYNTYGWTLQMVREHPTDTPPDRAGRLRLRGQAAAAAIERVGGGIVGAALTSIATFMVLVLSHYRGLRELGAVCGIGLVLILVMALVAAPAFLTLVGPLHVRPSRLLDRFAGNLLRWPKLWGGALAVLLILATGFLATRSELFVFDDDPRNLRPREDAFYERQLSMVQELGLHSSGHLLLLESEDDEALMTVAAELLQRLEPLREPLAVELAEAATIPPAPDADDSLVLADPPPTALLAGRHQALVGEQAIGFAGVADGRLLGARLLSAAGEPDLEPDAPLALPAGSTLLLQPALNRQTIAVLRHADPVQQRVVMERIAAIDWGAIDTHIAELAPDERVEIAPFLADLAAIRTRAQAGDPLTPGELVDGPLHKLIVTIYQREDGKAYLRLEVALTRLDSNGLVPLYDLLGLDADGSGEADGVHYGTAGPPSIATSIQALLESDFEVMGLLALAATALLIVLSLRTALGAAHALIALAGGLILALATLHLIGQTWNLMNISVLPLVVGIGCDHGIHFVHSLRHARHGGIAAVRQAISETGHPIVMTSLTSIVGFASLLLNSFEGMRSCGRVACIGIFCTMLVAMIGLPLLALRSARRGTLRSIVLDPMSGRHRSIRN